jgi:hypothetical protein
MSYISSRLAVFAFLASIPLIHGCATKQIISQWSNPEYAGVEPRSRLKRVMVVGVTEQTALRRNFEDRLARALEARGVDALQSYRFFPESGKIPEARLKQEIKRADADAVMISRLTRVERQTEVSPGYYHPFPAWRLYGWYSAAWYGGFYTPPRVYSYPVYYSETTLHDVAKDEIVWTATIRTVDPENVNEAIEEYVETVVKALNNRNIVLG